MKNLFARLLLERMENLLQLPDVGASGRRCPRAQQGPLIPQVGAEHLQIPESRPPASPTDGVEDLAPDRSFLEGHLPEAGSLPEHRKEQAGVEASLSSQPPGWGPRLPSAAHLKLFPSSRWPYPPPPPPWPEQGDRGHSINQTQEFDVTLQRFDPKCLQTQESRPQASPSSDAGLPTPAPSSDREVQVSSALLPRPQVASLCTFSFQETVHPLIPFGLLPLISPSRAWLGYQR